MAPNIRHITVHDGMAGQRVVTAVVEYPGETPTDVTFISSIYGGPVVMVSGDGTQTFVTEPTRFGAFFGAEWVRRFFTEED